MVADDANDVNIGFKKFAIAVDSYAVMQLILYDCG